MERIKHVKAAINLSYTNLSPPQSFISKLFIFATKFCYSWNWDIKINTFFLTGKQDLNWASFCWRHKDRELGMSLIQSPQKRAKFSLSCVWYYWSVHGENYHSRLWFYSLFVSIFFILMCESFNALIVIPGVYFEFVSTDSRTHCLGRNPLSLLNFSSLHKTSAFASGPG